MDSELTFLVSRQESPLTLVRFEDSTDANVPRLSYSVPLPGAFQGKFYIETDFQNNEIPWTSAAFASQSKRSTITDLQAALLAGSANSLLPIEDIATLPVSETSRRTDTKAKLSARFVVREVQDALVEEASPAVGISRSLAEFSTRQETQRALNLGIKFGDLEVDFSQVAEQASQGRAPVFYRTFGGTPNLTYVQEASSSENANPRFFIIEHYRLSSFFGDYGAGKTLGTFSLMPGEETTLYLRTWRRTQTTIEQASSIFDSFTTEAADEFETDVQSEITNSESESTSKQVHSKYSGSGEINIGLAKTKHSGERSSTRENSSARESMSKNVAKVTTHHSSKASSRRDIEVTQEVSETSEEEFERIVERKIKNTNLSRTLNIVTRELNQEFKTYLSLYDISIAFKNERNIFEVFQVHEIDNMLDKYIEDTATEGFVDPSSPFGGVTAKTFVRRRLIEQINEVFDFQGTRHDLLEEVSLSADGEQVFRVGEAPADAPSYLRVRRTKSADRTNPFYEAGLVPVEGIVVNETSNTVRTPAVIIDSLLGHGVALDNYALGQQQETLREKQLKNQRTELALQLIQNGDSERLAQFRQLFGSVDAELLEAIAVGGNTNNNGG